MTTIDPEVQRALDLRLAKGELSPEEYHTLLMEIAEGRKASLHRAETKSSDLLAEIDDLHIYSTHIQVAGRHKTFDEVTRVGGGSNSLTINLMPAIKHTMISVAFTNGDSYYMDEERTIFGRERHRKIAQCVTVLRRLTFKSRMSRLAGTLTRKAIPIGKESIETYTLVGAIADAVSKRQPAVVSLTSDGGITNGVLTLDLKRCRREGILELGVERANKYASGQVYACHDRSLFEKSRTTSLKFTIGGDYDDDVVLAFIDWLANPENRLKKQDS